MIPREARNLENKYKSYKHGDYTLNIFKTRASKKLGVKASTKVDVYDADQKHITT